MLTDTPVLTKRKTVDLSSAERCAQMDAIVADLSAAITQVNALTRAVCARNEFYGRPFSARLRWLLTGR